MRVNSMIQHWLKLRCSYLQHRNTSGLRGRFDDTNKNSTHGHNGQVGHGRLPAPDSSSQSCPWKSHCSFPHESWSLSVRQCSHFTKCSILTWSCRNLSGMKGSLWNDQAENASSLTYWPIDASIELTYVECGFARKILQSYLNWSLIGAKRVTDHCICFG